MTRLISFNEDRALFYFIIFLVIAAAFVIWVFYFKDKNVDSKYQKYRNDRKSQIESQLLSSEISSTYDDFDKDDNFNDELLSKVESIIEEDNLAIDITNEHEPIFTNREETLVSTSNKFNSKGEQICRKTLEEIYGVTFKNVKPTWLRNPETGRCLELDCYNDEYKIAVEYNGEQHYIWPHKFYPKLEDFKKQVRRDKYKEHMCKTLGIHLIIVPYTVKHDDIRNYIIERLPVD